MNEKNFAEGYNVLTGKVDNHPADNKYVEVHTGNAWLPAMDRYCQNKTDMPVGLVVFADKSHTDVHGALSLTPIIFTLTLFNRAAQNDSKIMRLKEYAQAEGVSAKLGVASELAVDLSHRNKVPEMVEY